MFLIQLLQYDVYVFCGDWVLVYTSIDVPSEPCVPAVLWTPLMEYVEADPSTTMSIDARCKPPVQEGSRSHRNQTKLVVAVRGCSRTVWSM